MKIKFTAVRFYCFRNKYPDASSTPNTISAIFLVVQSAESEISYFGNASAGGFGEGKNNGGFGRGERPQGDLSEGFNGGFPEGKFSEKGRPEGFQEEFPEKELSEESDIEV